MSLQDLAGSNTGKPAVCAASAPFDDASADTVLRTSDNVDFRVFRWFLKGMSPFFDDLFALPQPPGSISTDPILMSEPSSVLETLLRLHYPFPQPLTFSSFDDAKPVLAAAHKLQLTRIEPVLHRATLPYITENPLRAYGFALRHGMEDLVRLAAREFLMVQDFAAVQDSDELEGLSVAAYRRLLVYRQSCIVHLRQQDECIWAVPNTSWTCYACLSCVRHSTECSSRRRLSSAPDSNVDFRCAYCGTAAWFQQYMRQVAQGLSVTPSAAVIKDSGFITEAVAEAHKRCLGPCHTLAYEHMQRYTDELHNRVERIISEVQLEIK
ncbi:hypothetical protein K466DRAFT_568745 [Polyporus arcularius HHB13444]|uniref:BTB domain-containing protein n=1 Tax=Polyporus arcularius HHB13444 TaxID=1314778 RepID=A0A5C3NZD9_9APHY|nr:hypothetical protein K466DRAFT_568745 [Polyporus arcularius HHB13444]